MDIKNTVTSSERSILVDQIKFVVQVSHTSKLMLEWSTSLE